MEFNRVAWSLVPGRWTMAHLVASYSDRRTLCGLRCDRVVFDFMSGVDAEDNRGVCKRCKRLHREAVYKQL